MCGLDRTQATGMHARGLQQPAQILWLGVASRGYHVGIHSTCRLKLNSCADRMQWVFTDTESIRAASVEPSRVQIDNRDEDINS